MNLNSNPRQITPEPDKPRVAAFGEWDTTNLGDQAIYQGVIAFFEKAGWQIQGYGLGTLTPAQTPPLSAQLKTQPQVHPLSQLEPETSYKFLSLRSSQKTISKRLKRSIRPIRQHLRMQRLIPFLRQAKVIVVGGGALLSDQNLHFPQSLAVVTWVARKLQLPILCLGCSAEGQWSTQGQKYLLDFINSCTWIATRDGQTAHRLSKFLDHPVPIFGDFALPIKPNHKTISRSLNQGILAVNVMQLPEYWHRFQLQYEDVVIQIAKAWLEQNELTKTPTIRVFTTGNVEDIAPAQRVLARIGQGQEHLHLPTQLEDLRSLMHSSTVILASRLHSAILAIAEQVPVLGLSVSPKIQNFFESIGIQGYSVSALDSQVVCQSLNILTSSNFWKQPQLIDMSEIRESRIKVQSFLQELAIR